jgi:hypothetical protein
MTTLWLVLAVLVAASRRHVARYRYASRRRSEFDWQWAQHLRGMAQRGRERVGYV